MTLMFYNTLARKKDPFEPIDRKGKNVKMFVCGQTVYDDAHMGHAKTYLNFDVVVRWLRYLGYKVQYIQNITDVDDKIINRAKERNLTPEEISNYYTKRFFEDMEALEILKDVSQYPKCSEFIIQIIEQIETLIENGCAYAVGGDVYFDVAKYQDYTKLSGMSLEDLKKHRIEPNPKKRNVFDFSLWKHQPNAEIGWDSPWGYGRPGWHIEDTAMTFEIFGEQYDIHGGANELIFPHHTNEIAQAEAASGKQPFVKYWLHSGVLNIRGEKMSKSLKNFVTIREVLEKYDDEILRMFFASTHYRSPIDFSMELLEQAKQKLDSLYGTLNDIVFFADVKSKPNPDAMKIAETMKNEFAEAMNDDLNTPLAIKAFFDAAGKLGAMVPKGEICPKDAKEIVNAFKELGAVIGILDENVGVEKLPDSLMSIVEEREQARKKGDFAKSDALRDELKEAGIILEDTGKGVRWKRTRKR
ncbi:MAG: cysteine--tRNA ligase [Candidatus Aenigmatarchaeota archaeon]